jgi:hypothetical protein
MPHCMICLCLAVLAAPAHAQFDGFDRPTAGFVFSPGSHTIRPLLGIPGSTYIGTAIFNEVNAASVAPGGKWAFVATSTHSAFVSDLSAPAPAESAVGGIIDAVDRVAWSNSASFAVLYSSSSGRLQRVRLVDQVSVDDVVDLTNFGQLTAMAVDPSGRWVAFGIAGSGIYAWDGAQSPVLLVSMARPGAVAFSDTGRLYALDAETRKIVEFGADLSPSEFTVVNTVEGAEFEPVGLAISGTDKYLMVSDRATRTVRVYEIATRTLADTIPLDFAPTHMQRLSNGAMFLLNRARGNDWLLVLDATDKPRIYFVPAGEEQAQ